MYNWLRTDGVATLNDAALRLLPSGRPAIGSTLTIVTNARGTFAGLAEGASIVTSHGTYRITYQGGTGDDVVLTFLG